jgi:hypothetical protein
MIHLYHTCIIEARIIHKVKNVATFHFFLVFNQKTMFYERKIRFLVFFWQNWCFSDFFSHFHVLTFNKDLVLSYEP